MTVAAEKTKVAVVDHDAPLAPATEASAIVSMIERAARDPAVDMDKMERLLQMQERVMLRNAEHDFNLAMTDAQSKMRSVAADSSNPSTKSRYASYAALDRAVRPIYTAAGFSLSFDTADGAPADCVRVVCHVAKGGFSRTYHVDMPSDGKGAKGGDVMTKTHAVGAGMSYGQRYLLKMIFNMAVGDDLDGNKPADLTPITEDEVVELRDILESVACPLPKFLSHMRANSLADIPAARFTEAKTALANYAKAKGSK